MYLIDNYLDEEKLEQKPVRDGAGIGVMELGKDNKDIVVLTADVSSSARANFFEEKYEEKLEQKPVRDGAGIGVMELGKDNKDIVVLTADVSSSARANFFEEKYKERFIQCGVAEQNMAGIAGGLAYNGMRPFFFFFFFFFVGRNLGPIRKKNA